MRTSPIAALMAALSLATPFGAPAEAKRKAPPSRVHVGLASWYGPGFHGRRTASGEVYDQNRSTLASRTLPMGARVRVTYLKTGKSAIARVNDTGGFHRYGRIADCSAGLARRIGLKNAGVGKVKIEVLSQPRKKPAKKKPARTHTRRPRR